MKKQLAAGGLIFALGCTAHADSSVTLYGVMDSYIGYNQAGGKGTSIGLNGGGLMANRFGLLGHEDLGGGYRANFTIENGFFVESGALADQTRLFNRQAWVGFSGKPGEVRFGRQNSPQFYILGKLDSFAGATYGSGLNNMSGYTPRFDNVIDYRTPSFGGFSGELVFASGNQPGSVVSGSSYIGAADYQKGPLYLGVTHVETRSTGPTGSVKTTFAGGSYDIAKARIYVGYFRGNTFNASSSRNGNYVSLYGVSGYYSPTTFDRISLGYTFADVSGDVSASAHEVSLMWAHDISKRTELYGIATKIWNRGASAFYLKGAAPVPVNMPAAGHDVVGLQAGVRFLF